MFRIIQSLNNNAALVKNEHGEQAVDGIRYNLSKEERGFNC